ncbi:hypothetical protein KKG41_05155 [Patescibacteria group bacterium]|nr:hypothetical protein [Patescibacteria group bacterium]MBU1890863.1 hypothetical protein [Patescibacteria group bacterium]
MQFFTLKELMVLKKKGELDKQEIEKRQESIFLDVDYSQGKFEISSGEKAIQLSKNEIREDYDEVSQFKGTIAFQGKSTGKVRVIYGEKGFDKMKKGDILVTGMTRPEMIPVMKKAAAIITDEGGLTCHASIISRELKIPCIVATRIATKVLKDGDKVEVDAIQGLVRKL